jgi:dGTPase
VLEVSQVARTIARALRLNEDLAEAIALAHDLGHAPFGHVGEDALDRVLMGGYRHDEQSLRVVRYLERGGRGLNLTAEVLDGIRTHRKPRHSVLGDTAGTPTTLEAQVVKLSDAIAYINHDTDDAMRAGIIEDHDLPISADLLGRTRSGRINTLVVDIIATSLDTPRIGISEPVLQALEELRGFLFERVYTNTLVKREATRAGQVVTQLYSYYVENPEALPVEYREDSRGEGVERRVTDYIAGMTDSFAIHAFEELFVPKTWPVAFTGD